MLIRATPLTGGDINTVKGADIHVEKSNSSNRGWDINTVKGADIHVDKSNSSNRGGYKYCQKC